ncbi:hypothetical protein ACFL2U_02975 [Patescibacteria group bacterium]
MSNQEISQKILQTIKSKKIEPKPKCYFIAYNVIIWFLSMLGLLIGSLSFAVILYIIINNDWDVYKNINDSFWKFLLLTLPYLWLILLAIFIGFAYYNFKLTKKGYKFPFIIIIISYILISIIIGSILYSFGVGQAIDQALTEKTPLYTKMFNNRHNLWTQPEQGRLAGIIIEIKDQNIFLLNDLTKKEWQVISVQPLKPQFKPGIKIRVIGQQTEPTTFKAIQIIPFKPQLPKLLQQKRINLYFERNNF